MTSSSFSTLDFDGEPDDLSGGSQAGTPGDSSGPSLADPSHGQTAVDELDVDEQTQLHNVAEREEQCAAIEGVLMQIGVSDISASYGVAWLADAEAAVGRGDGDIRRDNYSIDTQAF